MIKRHLEAIAFSPDFGRQMRFIAGPRQSGKTTLAMRCLKTFHCSDLYYNWDNRKVLDDYLEDNHFFAKDIYKNRSRKQIKWLCLDEIHKFPKWKNTLKDFYDHYWEEISFIITGSAKLDMMRKSGDSLAGRFFSFHLNPLSLSEVIGKSCQFPPAAAQQWIEQKLDNPAHSEKALEQLLQFSGFPEPFTSANNRFHNNWERNYIDGIIREDLRDLTRIIELENIAFMMKLLPERIGSPLSINSLAQDMKCSFGAVKGYLQAMELTYLIFQISTYSRKIARSLTKEKKLYYYDWTKIPNPAKKFENYVAVELKILTDLWTDSGIGNHQLKYLRTRDAKETDFLILRDEQPWLLIEVKMKNRTLEYHHKKHRDELDSKIPILQIVRESNVAEKRPENIYQISAARFFQ